MATKKSAYQKKKDKELKKISSGYTTAEINKIIAEAKNVHIAKSNDLLTKKPTHKRSVLTQQYHRDCVVDSDHAYFEVNGQPLRVQTGFKPKRDVEVAETRLFNGFSDSGLAARKHLYFKGDAGLSFELTVILHIDDKYIGEHVGSQLDYKDKTVFSVLSDWNRTFQVCKIVTYAPTVENGYYRINKFEPEQTTHDTIMLDIGFIQDTYNYESKLVTKASGSNIKDIIDGLGTDKSNLSGTAKDNSQFTGLAKQIINCDDLYQKCNCITKKEATCVTRYVYCTYVLQQCLKRCGLYLDGRLDGKFCYLTHNAVIKYQKRYKDKVSVTGRVGPITRRLLAEDVQAYGK